MKSANNNLIDFFHEHIEENEWLDGLDIYQSGKVENVKKYDGLITSKLQSNYDGMMEVRIKIHPNGQQIQWIECTCKKNRAYNRYCEHMAAVMIHIDRENLDFVRNLNEKMPLKPPLPALRVKASNIQNIVAEKERGSDTAAGAILTHLNHSIHSVSLLAKGPSLRVRLEIKPGVLTHYDLDLDNSAKFLIAHPKLESMSSEVADLEIFSDTAHVGTRIYSVSAEEIVAEKVIAIRQKPKSRQLGTSVIKASATHIGKNQSSSDTGEFAFFHFKSASKHLGNAFFFQPHVGYWPYSKDEIALEWYELPFKKVYKEDDAAKFIREKFLPYNEYGSIWLSEDLETPNIVEAPQLLKIKIEHEDNGWFTLDPVYGDGKSTVSMVTLLKEFQSKKRLYHRSKNGWLKMPNIVQEFKWNLDETGNFLKVNSLGLIRLRAALGEFDKFAGTKKNLNLLRTQTEFQKEIETPPLTGSNLNLRNYQLTGLQWLWWLYKNNLHGLLADEMGLGKTHQAMGLMTCVQAEKKNPKFLAVCPTTVIDHWYDKVVEFCPNIKVYKAHGPKRNQDLSGIGTNFNLVITSYGILLRDIRFIERIKWDAVFLDEAHFVKNNDTATYQAACRLDAGIRICLSGTPIENNLAELKNIFDFLLPGYMGSDDFFRSQFIKPINLGSQPETDLALQKLIHPFKMRRTKENVLKDLPEKVIDFRHCELSSEQTKMYREVLELKARPILDQLKDDKAPVSYLHVFAILTLLKQICDHPALVSHSDYHQHESGKFELLKELLSEALDSGHKIVIFSQYVEMIRIIENYLSEISIEFVSLTGQSRNRGQIIEQFQTNPNIKVFVGSLLAGGIGIDLTAASVVIHYDRWWNASKENQATDRVHRIGQNKNVLVLKLITKGTLEEKIDLLIQKKQIIFEKFMDQDENTFKNLSREDIIELLQ